MPALIDFLASLPIAALCVLGALLLDAVFGFIE